MSIFANASTRLVIQGITGREGSFHAKQMLEYAAATRSLRALKNWPASSATRASSAMDATTQGSAESTALGRPAGAGLRDLAHAVGGDQPLPAPHRRHRAAVLRRGAQHPCALHLGAVLALFLTMPYGKFVHGLYRAVALLRFHAERRRPVPAIAPE